jgi:hypothetical protein
MRRDTILLYKNLRYDFHGLVQLAIRIYRNRSFILGVVDILKYSYVVVMEADIFTCSANKILARV